MKSFKDLDVKELRRAAIEDFAVEVPEDANAKEIVAAFTETGITWADYVAQHPDLAEPEEEAVPERVKEKVRAGAVVTSADVTGKVDSDAVAVQETATIRVAEPAIKATADKYLIKMVRDNTLFETRGYRFTQEHPYALVSAEDAQYILSREEGFRQAFPDELEEFYG